MTPESVVETLTDEHHDLDRGIESFVAQVEGGTADPAALDGLLASLRRHIYLEEEFMFPPMARGGLVMPIAVMMREHGQLWRTMDALTEAAGAGGSEPDAPARVLSLCAELLAILASHNSKEEPIVYPQTAVMLDLSELDDLGTALQTEGMPDGWVCREAAAR